MRRSRTYYVLTIDAEDFMGVYETLDEARGEALEYVESQGWVHEQQYANAPIGGFAWACPGEPEMVTIRPIIAESEDDAYALAIMLLGPRYLT
jgi:hypothetical protein